ncbi:DM13 domain-containing protein [Antiquaquibacter oligotrophicus]|uniref:DM13 domain-containing protein n=1 Tax=Antiquaquibacter oligotrophicus TaxID=2880260 RepID=UPI002AC9A43C|nr:DM13 domain-containing protein [Antiquaquibacter oligotrophicus]UDF12702.1 DM13 domain-containing protein [Antiquaquibacter oligotrophicus]
MSKKWVITIIAGVAAVGLVVAAALFQPWLLFVDVEVDEALPAVETAEPSAAPMPTVTPSPEPAAPVQLSVGELISHEHETTGTVRIIENPDGSRVLTLENLSTSNGPDVHVWLAETPVVPGFDGWFLADDAGYVDLGTIKGNLGNQVYEIPADVDLGAYPSVYLWCAQFAVSFGAASVA